jgi:hypothetical protein
MIPSGSTAYSMAKAKEDNSMLTKRETPEGMYGVVLQDPSDMVKAELLEPQLPAVKQPAPR